MDEFLEFEGTDHISPSQVDTWLMCRLRWYYRYRLGYKMPPSGALVFGKATHKAVEGDLTNKMAGVNVSEDEIKELFEFSLRQTVIADEQQEQSETVWHDGDSIDKATDDGVRLVGKYKQELSDKLTPVDVEKPFEIVEDGVKIVGRADLLQPDSVDDFKTSSKTKPESDYTNKRQLAIYSKVFDKPQTKIHLMVRKKDPAIVTYDIQMGKGQQDAAINVAKIAKREMEAGHIFPNTEGWHCSEKWCGFWNLCKKEGIVK